eukprot:GFKZ01002177.1.p1 GENE.GFKZ01002177.1~~GFKZ01002177.1.p1  ORF type:complete len:396 (+),score=49.99 GFKZ01002177.1:1090-2277(+)
MPSLDLVASLRGHQGIVWSIAWSPLGFLASCGVDRTIRIWNSSSDDKKKWQCALTFDDNKTFLRTVRDMSWSADGRSLACACFDAVTYVLELIGGKEPKLDPVLSLEGHDSETKGVCYTSGGALLASCSRDRSVWVWEAGLDFEYECIAVLNGHTADVKSVVWHPSIELLVSCSYDGTMRVWVEDDDDWFCLETLAAQSGTVWSASFDKEGRSLVSVAEDGSMVVWKREDPPATVVGGHPFFKVVARTEKIHDGPIYCVDWGKTNGLIATAGGDDAINILRKKDTANGNGSNTLRAEEMNLQSSTEPQISAKGDGDQQPPNTNDEEGEKEIKEGIVTSKLSQQYEVTVSVPRAHTGDVNRVGWHPLDATLLASCSDDGLVRIWQYNEANALDYDT